MRYASTTIPPGPAGQPGGGSLAGQDAGPLAGVELALRGLGIINDWLAAMAQLPAGAADHDDVQALLVGLGHIDAVALAALSGAIVLAEETDCATTDGQVSVVAWVAAQLRMSGAAATRACRLAADLDGMDQVAAELRAGRISRDHAIKLAEAARQQQADQRAAERARRAAQAKAAEDRRRRAEQAAAAARDEAQRQALLDRARKEEQRRRAHEEAEAASPGQKPHVGITMHMGRGGFDVAGRGNRQR
jgi:colicin import membrane protein